METIAVSVIVLYLIAATATGSLMARRTTTSTGWAVAGGGMSTVLVAVGIAGTRIGGAGTYGVAGDVISGGVWNLWWYGISTFLALSLVGLFFAVYYRRLRLQTVGEIFTRRWGNRRCQWLTSLCVQTEYVIVNLIEAYVIGVIVSTLTPLSMFAGVMVSAAIFGTYVSLGGLWGTAITNLIHCVVGARRAGRGRSAGRRAVRGLERRDRGGRRPSRRRIARRRSLVGFRRRRLAAGVRDDLLGRHPHAPASVYTNYAAAARSERRIAPAFVAAGLIAAVMPMLAGLIAILTTARYGLDTGSPATAT